MSLPIFASDTLFCQRLLKAEGLYKHELNGIWDSKTESAFSLFEQRSEEIKLATFSFESRSEKCIASLTLRAQKEARVFLKKVRDGGINARIISGTRTYKEQDFLFRKGRFGNPPPIVTKARGGFSNHNFGVAWDIGIFTASGGYITEGKIYEKAARLGMSPQLEWGGNWVGFVDPPHYQLKLDIDLKKLRTAFESGNEKPIFA